MESTERRVEGGEGVGGEVSAVAAGSRMADLLSRLGEARERLEAVDREEMRVLRRDSSTKEEVVQARMEVARATGALVGLVDLLLMEVRHVSR